MGPSSFVGRSVARGRVRSFGGLGFAGVLSFALLSGCTIGARTPVPVGPSEPEPKPETKDEEDFRLPEAEFVRDTGRPAPAASESSSAYPRLKFNKVGHAQIGIGRRAPWASLSGLDSASAPNKATPKVSSSWRLDKTITVGEGYLHQAAFTADEQALVTLSTQSGTVYHFGLDGKLVNKWPLPSFHQFDDAVFAVIQEVRERTQLVVARPTGTSLLDLLSGRFDQIEYIPPGNAVQHSGRAGLYGIAYRKIEPQSGELRLQWIDGEVALVLKGDHRPDGFALSPDGRYLAVSYYPVDEVEVTDLQKMSVVSRVALPKWGSAIAISPDGSLLAMGGEKLRVVRFPSGELLAEDAKYGNNIGEVRFTPQGDLLLASAFDGKARSYVLPKDTSQLTSLPAPQELRHLGQANVYALGLSEDGSMLVTSSGDKTLKLWRR